MLIRYVTMHIMPNKNQRTQFQQLLGTLCDLTKIIKAIQCNCQFGSKKPKDNRKTHTYMSYHNTKYINLLI